MREAYCNERRTDTDARAETQRGLDMLDREVRQARPSPEYAADEPPMREIWVELQRTIDQSDHRANVLTERGQCEGGIRQDVRIVAGHFQGPPGEIDALHTVRRRILAPAVRHK